MQRKTTKKEAWQPKCAAPRLGYEQNQKATYCCFYLGYQNEVTFIGGISERRPKSEAFVLLCSFVFVGIISSREGGREGRREVLLSEAARVAASCQVLLSEAARVAASCQKTK